METSTKERILEEALNLFSQNGYAGTSMSDIAGALGITKAALYKHFSAKEDIWEAFDYVKIGPYIESLGPLNSVTTNQRLYHHREDITARFWTRGIDKNKTPD